MKINELYKIVKTDNFIKFIIRKITASEEEDYLAIGTATRSDLQNRMFHGICGQVAGQIDYMGKKRTAQQWKVLFISGHAIATGLGADVVPGIEGEFCNIRESSANMSIKRMNSVIEYVLAFCAEHEIKLIDNRYEGYDP